ncbi:MAG: alpha/beta hydrolase [Flavobacteriales bacterium]|nr:alpha/beta hydrolase [Flavobacteriales bacterium]
MKKDKSYKDSDSWKGFQEYFPERFQIKEGGEPEEEYWNWKDNRVHIDRYLPKKNEKKIKVILVHGGGANGRLMFPMGVALRSSGYECIAADFPGFGLTVVNKPNSYYTWIDLVVDLIEREKERDDREIVLCGISLGGMLSYQAACKSKHVIGIIVTALADPREKKVQVQLSKNKFMSTFGVKFTEKMGWAFDGVRFPIKDTTKMWAMANNKEFVDKLLKDKVGSGSKVYLKSLRTLFQAGPALEPEDFKEIPVLLAQPEKDFIIPLWVSEPFFNRLACPKELVMLEGAGHIPLEEPGITQLEQSARAFIEKLEQELS